MNNREHFIGTITRNTAALIDSGAFFSSSYIGVYLQSVALAFKKLDFSSTSRLFELWRLACCEMNLRRMTEKSVTVTETPLRSIPILPDSARNRFSNEDHQAVAQLSSRPGSSTVNDNTYVFLEHHVQCEAIGSGYLEFQSAWESGDYVETIRHLQRYFDYSAYASREPILQYALFNFALVQAAFDCHREALWAIYEAIDAARDCNDEQCLSMALTWLRQQIHDSSSVVSIKTPRETENIEKTKELWSQSTLDDSDPSVVWRAQIAQRLDHLTAYKERASGKVLGSYDFSISEYISLAEDWHDRDSSQLSQLSIRLATPHENQRIYSVAEMHLRCVTANIQFQQGNSSAAMQTLTTVPKGVLRSHIQHRIWSCQMAFLRLALGRGSRPDEVLELQEIERRPRDVKFRVERYVNLNRLVEARALTLYHLAKTTQYKLEATKRKVLLFQLLSTIYIKSATPELAYIMMARAAKLAHDAHLFRSYKEVLISMKSMANSIIV